jgi:hypothetical protein
MSPAHSDQRDRILSALRRGVSRADIATYEGCTRARVDYIASRSGLAVVGKGRTRTSDRAGKGDAAVGDAVGDAPAPNAPALQGDIAATQGRYAELAAYACQHGLTHARALQLWHKARVGLPVSEGGRA